jgi:hypothetical protein
MKPHRTVWVFVAPGGAFPGGVFEELHDAEEWIANHALTGTLTRYPVGIGAYDWAVEEGAFTPKPTKVIDSTFIGRFTSATMNHHHYEGGKRVA